MNAAGITEDRPANVAPRFTVPIEGREYPSDKPIISVPEIRRLGNLPDQTTVVEEDDQGRERTLQERETIILKPGHRYGRASKYRRGSYACQGSCRS